MYNELDQLGTVIMTEYDFKNINPIEFEALSNDLLSALFEIHVERFKPGKDLGIDGRFFHLSEGKTIIQSKHYAETGFPSLLRDLIKNEFPKIKKLSPEKYIVSTSVSLSPQEKEKIKTALAPYIKDSSYIFGKNDLNALIRKYPKVEKAHYKLWIASSTVLAHFLNAEIYNASHHVISEAYSKSSHYAFTHAHSIAKDKINSSNVLVITGEPGVGKTTLAEQICLEFVADEYEFITINSDIEEGFKVYTQDNKQIFYFDDFLGKNYLETLRLNEDARIMQFISLIGKSKNKKFILTSRTNILDQGYRIGPSFIYQNIKNREYILDVTNYTPEDKAKILYNFLWRSTLTQDFIELIVSNKKYREVVYHKNYNPRLLEFITSSDHVINIEPNNYIRYIDESLKNPKDVWNHPYTVQLDDTSRAIVDLLVFGNGRIEESSLRKAYSNYLSNNRNANRSNISRDFDSTMSVLSRSFAKRAIGQKRITVNGQNKYEEVVSYTPFNPSISDFVLGKFSNDYQRIVDSIILFDGMEGLNFLEGVSHSNKDLSQKVASLITTSLNEKIAEKGIAYIMRVGNLLAPEEFYTYFNNYSLSDVTKHITELGYVDEHILKFSSMIISAAKHSDEELAVFYLLILEFDMDYWDIEYISSMLIGDISEKSHDEIIEKFYQKLLDEWKYNLIDEFAINNVDKFSREIIYEYDEDNIDYEYEIDKDMLASLVNKETQDFITPIETHDAKNMFDYIDLNDIVSSYFRNENSSSAQSAGPGPIDPDIDSIFEGFISAKFS